MINTIILESVFVGVTLIFYVTHTAILDSVFTRMTIIFDWLNPINLLLFITVVMAAIGLLRGISDSRRMVSHPVCRFTDDFIILDYDRKAISIKTVTRIVIDPKRRIIKIWHPTIKDSLIQTYPEEHADIRGNRMSNWDSFLEDLESMCKERSIEMKRMSS